TTRPVGSDFICTQPETITPGRTVGETVAKAVGSDLDFIVGADDLTQYVAAMVDAVINRLTKEGTKGLAGIFEFDDEGKNIARGDAYGEPEGNIFLVDSKEELLGLVETASTTLGLAEDALDIASSTNNNLISILNSLIECDTEGVIDPNATTTLAEAEVRVGTIGEMLDEAVSYRDRLDTLPGDIGAASNPSALSEILTEINVLISTIDGLFNRVTGIQNTVESHLDEVIINLLTCEGF
ncbi:unnamed protein product, partial [marine sediment metagenome]